MAPAYALLLKLLSEPDAFRLARSIEHSGSGVRVILLPAVNDVTDNRLGIDLSLFLSNIKLTGVGAFNL